jgi:N-acetylated-alpha-linked acidic dipeptidase
MRNISFLRICLLVLLVVFGARTLEVSRSRGIEDEFLKIPNAARLFEGLAYYTSSPHIAGSREDYETAHFTLQKFRSFGLNAWIEEEHVLLSYPNRKAQLRLLSPVQFEAQTEESYILQDPTSSDSRIVPTFNGYAPSGNITGELVYVNYGRYEDFQMLASHGIHLQGKIAIARYGKIFRGLKAYMAQQFGMLGVIIYTDPADTGYVQGQMYPNGPWSNPFSVQRGSVQFLSICPGDPRRIKECGYPTNQLIPQIPVQPISWSDAAPLLAAIGGPVAPTHWQGGLNFTYHIGPGPAIVNLVTDIRFNVTTIWNVVGEVTADVNSLERDRIVVLGNHRDAWVFGAVDPSSGSTSLLEIARAYGELLRSGWKPKRRIWLCSWDGEEYGLLGSTAFVERLANELNRNAIVYLNGDAIVSGSTFACDATPSLHRAIKEAANKIINPSTNKPYWSSWDGKCGVLGSGSDYTSFLDYIGIASVDVGTDGPYGVYHSAYDSMTWMTHFGDPTFQNHIAITQLWGLLGLKYANEPILPMNYSDYARALWQYFSQIQQLITQYNITHFDLSQLRGAIQNFTNAASNVDIFINEIDASNTEFEPELLSSLNDRLAFTERRFINRNGLPKRIWYKHVIQAPGLFLGYGATVFPGLYQEIMERNLMELKKQEAIAAFAINQAAIFLKGITNLR